MVWLNVVIGVESSWIFLFLQVCCALIKPGLLKRMRIGLSTSSVQPLQFCDSAKGKFEVCDG